MAALKMPIRSSTHVTFAVDSVEPATNRRTEVRAYEALRDCIPRMEACHDYRSLVVENVRYHGLVAAVHIAFSEHRPLVLSPDHIWLTIAQGVAHHMAIHSERLREQFVSHSGQLKLTFACDWPKGSPENPWPVAFAGWTEQIRGHVGGDIYNTLVCDFSTSGPVELAASQVVMMDIFERYFHYCAMGICGIPTITLEGTTQDWEQLAAKVEQLHRFDLGWWVEHLRPICDQFMRASRGDIDAHHWQNICKLQSAYGGDIINGWVAKLFPYIREFPLGPCRRKNPVFDSDEGFTTLYAPSGLSRVPFIWEDLRTWTEHRMEAIGGFLGVTQDESLALRPKIGWAAATADELDVRLADLQKHHRTQPGVKLPSTDEQIWTMSTEMPMELSKLYAHTDGAEVLAANGEVVLRIRPMDEVQPLDWGENLNILGDTPLVERNRYWRRFADLPDGTFLAFTDRLHGGTKSDRIREVFENKLDYERFVPICVCSPHTVGLPGKNPLIALSFGEWLTRLLTSATRPYWLANDFRSHGDAEELLNRDEDPFFRKRLKK